MRMCSNPLSLLCARHPHVARESTQAEQPARRCACFIIDKQLYMPIHCELRSAQRTDIRFDKHAPLG